MSEVVSVSPNVPEPRVAMNKWTALALLSTLAFLNYLDRNLVFPVFGLISKDLGLSEAQLGLLASGFQLVYAASAPLLGYVSDRVARKTVLLVSLVLWSVVTALSGTANGFVGLLVWRSLTGLGEGGYFPTAVSLIGDLFPRQNRGKALALHGVCATLGGSAGYALGGALGETMGWRMPFFLSFVPGLILAATVMRFFREPTRGAYAEQDTDVQEPQAGHSGAPRPYYRVVLSPAVLLISLAACFAAFAMNGFTTFFPKYLEDERGFSVASAGIWTGVFYSATLIGQLSGGALSDGLACKVTGARPMLVAVAYLTVAPLAFGIPLATATLALFCFGAIQVTRGFAEPNLYGTVIDSVEAHDRGKAQGFLLMLSFAGASASPRIAGSVIEAKGYTACWTMLAVSAAIAGALGLALFSYMRRFHALTTIRQQV